MRKKNSAIPINTIADDHGAGVTIERMAVKDLHTLGSAGIADVDEARRAHREEHHSFFLLQQGTVHIEIDFQKHTIKAGSVVYMHPDQVHRIMAVKDMVVTSLAISNEQLDADYLKLLETITPAEPLLLKKEAFTIISEAAALCIKFTERNSDKLYHSLLRNSCNALVALIISQYLARSASAGAPSRFDVVTRDFRALLERGYTTAKRPADYARQLNISIPYLNECVKSVTGYSVSHHIQQRIILEAKRLLHHSDRSVKEIATELGYDDYPYFSRLFTKVAGMTALAFRTKNLG